MATPNTVPPTSINYFSESTYQESVQYLLSRLPDNLKKVQIGIITGSGLGGLAATLDGPLVEVEYKVQTTL
jgi:purine-nucleoside phosphorylase